MTRIVYTGPFDEVITKRGIPFKKGEPVDVPQQVAAKLPKENFKPATKKAKE